MLRQFLSLNICIGCISIAIGSSAALADYYPQPVFPDYDIVTIPCYDCSHNKSYHKPYHKHYYNKHKKYSRQHSSYVISKYYMYNTPTGHIIAVPVQKGGCRTCCGTGAILRHRNNYQGFSEAPYPYRETELYVNEPIEDFVMDMRTSDDINDSEWDE